MCVFPALVGFQQMNSNGEFVPANQLGVSVCVIQVFKMRAGIVVNNCRYGYGSGVVGNK